MDALRSEYNLRYLPELRKDHEAKGGNWADGLYRELALLRCQLADAKREWEEAQFELALKEWCHTIEHYTRAAKSKTVKALDGSTHEVTPLAGDKGILELTFAWRWYSGDARHPVYDPSGPTFKRAYIAGIGEKTRTFFTGQRVADLGIPLHVYVNGTSQDDAELSIRLTASEGYNIVQNQRLIDSYWDQFLAPNAGGADVSDDARRSAVIQDFFERHVASRILAKVEGPEDKE